MFLQFGCSFDKRAVKFPIKVKILFNSWTKSTKNANFGEKNVHTDYLFLDTRCSFTECIPCFFFAESSKVFIKYLKEIRNFQEKKVLLSRCSSRCVKRTFERAANKVRKKDMFYAPMSAND